MTRAAAFLVASLAALGASPPPLAERLDALLTKPGIGFAGVQVVEVASGAVLYRHNEDRRYQPASNLKLLTSALALDRLKPGYRYRTRVLLEESGDLALIGSGDPSLSGRIFPYDKSDRALPPLTPIEELVDQIVASGVSRVAGNIVGDDCLYPWDPFPPSWTVDDTLNDYGAPVSALSFNENVVKIFLRPASLTGEPAVVSFSPALELFSIENRVTTTARGTRRQIHWERMPHSNQWRVTGSLPLGSAYSELIPVSDPALFAATALYDVLVRRGVAVMGGPVARHCAIRSSYVAPAGREIALRDSPPLNELLQVMNKVSHNLFAELFLREVARVSGSDATTAEGARLLSAYLTQAGNPISDFRLDDGSGLSRNAMVTPRLLTRVLTEKARGEDADAWIALLPIGGEDGTLEKRLCCVSDGRPHQAMIQAKTGSLDRVASLSGYARSKTRGLLAFSILMNGFALKEAEARQWVDRMALALLE